MPKSGARIANSSRFPNRGVMTGSAITAETSMYSNSGPAATAPDQVVGRDAVAQTGWA